MNSSSSTPLALVGDSSAVCAARAAFSAAATVRAPVLINAESGCRPRDLARVLHAHSRAAEPFVEITCGADDSRDVEHRLFGELLRRSAPGDLELVTGRSAVVQAGEGILFLDDIDELSASSQRRLARILRDVEVRVPGSGTPVMTGFRLVAATSRDLNGEARDGRFRRDLLRRLVPCSITVPALRQRTADIPAIIEAFCLEKGRDPVEFTAPALTVLMSLAWPRNIDELCEMVEWAGQLATGPVRQEDILTRVPLPGGLGRIDLTTSLREARRQFERDYIAAVLGKHGWSVSEAARTLGIERANLYRKVRQIGLVLPPAERTGWARS